ncbi:DsbA family protein [Polymorphum gilvum]|uniref:DSBA-like thioredoxin domain protein n=1 Tax=Polymorphum gilvum (strain LMG 25793 / CGMCC 1.9160 / SL003B-26A1) TaxID=991905 RepID=F2IXF4_POLGS|nr:DsbA family protein [Polymorphum gilvum]ADZ70472.1 DSBA-like thioredoxin domain protein [Polymorphum gilvum SL003B-26A1]
MVRKSCVRAFSAALSLLALLTVAVPAPAVSQELDRSKVEQIVREYLLANPEVVRDAIIELDRREKEAEAAARQAAVSDAAGILYNSTRQAVLGNPDGGVTMVEFFDYNCGYCKRALGDMDRLIAEDPNLRVVLKEFPVLGQGSMEAAQVAIAVNTVAPEKYGDFHAALLNHRGQANKASALEIAASIGLSGADLEAALASPEVGATVEEVYTLANRLGLTGTPSYVIGTEVIMGAVGYNELRQKIEAMRACDSTTC